MTATIQQIIGKINPRLYADNGSELLKKYKTIEDIPAEEVKPKPIGYTVKDDVVKIGGDLLGKHKLIYDSSSDTLEPIYFFILDLMNSMGLSVEKYIDNFSSSPGSGHFAELGQRATVMQQQASKLLGDANTVLRSVLNIIYDLREFNIRLQHYENLKSGDSNTKESAFLTLKQIWMDKVDVLKGNSSIKAMALGQAGYQTLIDAFMVIKDEKDVKKIDLNDRVKRILLPRIEEFNVWVSESEKELRKRYDLEKNYLRSQVNSLKLYSRWAKPYLRAAQQLESIDKGREPDLVKVFNTILLELSILGKSELKLDGLIAEGRLSKDFAKIKMKKKYYQCTLVDFRFRGIPQKISQQSHFAFGGRAEVLFSAYALTDEELKKLDEEMDKSDLSDAFKLIGGITDDSLEKLEEDIEFFLEDEKDSDDVKKNKEYKDKSNPFLALIGTYDRREKKKDKKKKNKKDKESKDKGPVKLSSEDYVEKNYLRVAASEGSLDTTFNLFNTYKKAHGMATP